jgi:hypothetical protein
MYLFYKIETAGGNAGSVPLRFKLRVELPECFEALSGTELFVTASSEKMALLIFRLLRPFKMYVRLGGLKSLVTNWVNIPASTSLHFLKEPEKFCDLHNIF